MEWWFYGPILLAVVMFLLVGTIFEKRIEQAMRSFIQRRRMLFRQQTEQTSTEPCSTATYTQSPGLKELVASDLQSLNVLGPKTSEALDCKTPVAAEIKTPVAASLKTSVAAGIKTPLAATLKTVAAGVKTPVDTSHKTTDVPNLNTDTPDLRATVAADLKLAVAAELKTLIASELLTKDAAVKTPVSGLSPKPSTPASINKTSSLPNVSIPLTQNVPTAPTSRSTSKRSLLTCKSAAILSQANMEHVKSDGEIVKKEVKYKDSLQNEQKASKAKN